MDVVQETFAYLYRKFPGFRLTANMTTFLYPVVRNLSLAIRRKRRRVPVTYESILDVPAPQVESVDARVAELAAVLGSLPSGQREVVLLRFVDGLTIDEIAATLKEPAGTVKSRLHHAIRALRQDPRISRYFQQ
jgi:RNA polymerase sigma-70 factor (ECF subfamily)